MTTTRSASPDVGPERAAALRDFRRIPGVGPSIAVDLWELGFRATDELRAADPQEMYDRFCRMKGMHIDRCLLYVFRCAVYFASHPRHDPELLLWWSWKDGGPAYTRYGG
ncbi:MAG: pathogenicity locus [Gemmatimonadetes bacterium]|nr:pathogenicity locus [Gemmatimonadota bacterium]